MPRFVVDLGDMDIPEEMSRTIAEDLQKTALSHLAKLRIPDPIAVKFPKDWWGLIARFKLDAVVDAESVLQKNLFAARGMR